MDLSVIILNWNTRALLEKCLQSVLCSGTSLNMEVVVVDNASEDNSREMVRTLYPEVTLIENPINIGFGAGNNVAIPKTTGRYLLFLNTDTLVMEGALPGMVRYADQHPEIGILGPKLLNGDGSLQFSCRAFPSLGTGFFRNTPLGRLFPKNRFTNDYLLKDWDHAQTRDVDWLSGAALMVRRRLVEQIGGFDEAYFMFCEDVDLCWRAHHTPLLALEDASSRNELLSDNQKASGERPATRKWRVTYFPEAIIYHLIGKSTDMAPTRMTYEFHRSQYLFYRKHYAAETFLLLRPLIPIGIALRAVGQMARFRARYWQRKIRGFGKKSRSKDSGGSSSGI